MELNHSRIRPSVMLLMMALLPIANVFAQNSGSLRGIVLDLKHAALPNTYIELTSAGLHLKAVSNERGEYSFQDVVPGEYELRAQQAGFHPRVVERLRIREGVRLLDLPLDIDVCGHMDDRQPLDAPALSVLEIHVKQTPYGMRASQPTANVLVRLKGDAGGAYQVKTNKLGAAVIRDIRPDAYASLEPGTSRYLTTTFAGWKTVVDVDLGNQECPEKGCDSKHPRIPTPIGICE